MINVDCINKTGCESATDTANLTTYTRETDDQFTTAAVVLQLIQFYYTPVLVVLGCVGNTLSVLVFFCTKLKKLSSSYYLATLAFSDSGFLIAHFISWLNLVDIPLFKKSGICELTIYSSHICSFLSVWLVVLFTIERFIAVRYPLHRPAVCTVARAKLFICCLMTTALTIYSPYLVIAAPQVHDITLPNSNETVQVKICAVVPSWMSLASLLNHIDFFLTLVLPFCTIVVMNTLICRTVHHLAQVRRTMTLYSRKRFFSQRIHTRRSTENHIIRTYSHRSSSNSQSKVTQMLLVVSTVFICLNLPSYLLRVWVYISETSETMEMDNETMGLLQHYSNILFATNFGINFVLYCISGQNFRKALCSLSSSSQVRRGQQEHTQATALSEYCRGPPITNSVRRNLTFPVNAMDGTSSLTTTTFVANNCSGNDTNR